MRCDKRFWLAFVPAEPYARVRCQDRAGHAGWHTIIEPISGRAMLMNEEGKGYKLPAKQDEDLIQRAVARG